MDVASRERTVGFIGLGMMGMPMAKNILKAGFPLVACDINPAKTAEIAALGARIVSTPAEVGRQAGIVISMVDTTAQAEEVIVQSGGLIDGLMQGDVVISMSTIDPGALRDMHARLKEKGVGLLDSPVAGMEKGAIAGTLRAYIGGDAPDLEKAMPVLRSMANDITHLGEIGRGTIMKLLNNLLCQVGWVVVAEAMVLGTKAGLDAQTMFDLIGRATGNSVAFQYMAPRLIDRNFDGIRLDITYKDIEIQNALGNQLKVPMFMTNMAQQVYQIARAAGHGSEDGVAVVKAYELLAGVTVGGKS